jgi:quinol monooxygenase YgiN
MLMILSSVVGPIGAHVPKENIMKLGFLARIEAKPEFAAEVADLLAGAVELARQEDGTLTWYAFRESETVFGIFDTFADEAGRTAHIEGPIAAALGANTDKLASAPSILPVDVLAAKAL